MADRIACLIPFCRRTTKADDPVIEWPDDGWICGNHWRSVPTRMKAIKRRARRRLRRHPDDPAAIAAFARISARCTRAALDAAAGI